MDDIPGLVTRDALHTAIALEHTRGQICSFESDFDRIERITRHQPA